MPGRVWRKATPASLRIIEPIEEKVLSGRPAPRGSEGFTLIETLVSLTVLALLLVTVAPGFKAMIDGRRLDNYASEFRSAVALAKAESLRRGFNTRVTLQQRVLGDWSKGWCVKLGNPVTGSDGSTSGCDAAAGVTVIQDSGAYASGVSVTHSGLSFISFVASGEAIAPVSGADATYKVGAYQSGWINLKAGSASRCLLLVPPGLVEVRVNPASCP